MKGDLYSIKLGKVIGNSLLSYILTVLKYFFDIFGYYMTVEQLYNAMCFLCI